MAHLSDEDREIIDTLSAQGKTVKEIRDILGGCSYTAVWNRVNKEIVSKQAKKRHAEKVKQVNTISTTKYVPSDREMPPIYPPGDLLIINDKELAEIACKQLGLGKPVTTLANRPRNISHSGMRFIDGKWIANPAVSNEGMVKYCSLSMWNK